MILLAKDQHIEYYLQFLEVILYLGAGYLRVTHPFATLWSSKQAYKTRPFDLHA